MLTKKQFDILASIEKNGMKTQRALASETGMSLGAVNKILSQLTESELLCDGKITPKGLDTLEPYRVKRAVFIAAGIRISPCSDNAQHSKAACAGKGKKNY